MIYKTLLLLSLLASACSTYIPIKYRVPSEYGAPKGSTLKISFSKETKVPLSEQNAFLTELKHELILDDWWAMPVESTKEFHELIISELETLSQLSSSSSSTNEAKKEIRHASYMATAMSAFKLRAPKKTLMPEFRVTATSYASSSQELPPAPNLNKFWSGVEMLLGVDNQGAKISSQDSALYSESLDLARKDLSKALLQKITPLQKTAEVMIEDDQDDMEPVLEYARKKEFEEAYQYLLTLQKHKNRSDILYNLAVIQEASGKYENVCKLYQDAYVLNARDLYLKELSGCITRQNYRSKTFTTLTK